jgi:uncharacterized damage-inducible protein DinB
LVKRQTAIDVGELLPKTEAKGPIMTTVFRQLAAYNSWANERLFDAALELPEELYRADVGVFFRSLHGTLNHLLLTDRLWLTRLTGVGQQPKRLDEILYHDRLALARARLAEDERLVAVIGNYDDAVLVRPHAYQTTSGMPQEQPLSDILLHIFNHQTHHRGQAHACLSITAKREPPPLDLLMF